MMKPLFSTICTILASTLFTGCSLILKNNISNYESQMAYGQYAQAAIDTEALAKKQDESELLWHLYAGNAFMMNGNSGSALNHFDAAEDVFIQNDNRSPLAHGANVGFSILTNEADLPYAGMGQDRIFCCLYKAICYGADGQIAPARTELNRAAQHQDNWLYERKNEIEANRENFEKETLDAEKQKNMRHIDHSKHSSAFLTDGTIANQLQRRCDFNPASSGMVDLLATRDFLNVYAQHFCGIFRWINHDSARGFLKDTADIAMRNPIVQQDFKEIESGIFPQNQVWVYIEDGLAPRRQEWRIDVPMFLIPFSGKYVLYSTFALPYLEYRPQGAFNYGLDVNGKYLNFTTLENIDRLIKIEFDIYLRQCLVREFARLLFKTGAQAALGIAAEGCDNDASPWLRTAQIGFAGFTAFTTSADLRSWLSLPKNILLQRFTRPQNGVFTLYIGSTPYQIPLKEGNSIVWVRNFSQAAPPTFKIITAK